MRAAILLGLLLASAAGCRPAVEPVRDSPPRIAGSMERAIWVTRFDYRSRADVERIIAHCADAGFDTVLWQVRGNATAFYDSPYEPWAEQLGGRDPGFDPLALACSLARRRGISLHAWVNVMPAWWGTEPPEDPEQLYHTRPEWMWYDQHGGRQALSERFYVSVNPCLPEVRAYLVLVCADLAERYDIDGLHLDYVRFPNEPPATPAGSGFDYPRDARTLALFRDDTGLDPDGDPAAWDAWRTERVTELVRRIRRAAQGHRPDLVLSAAVTSVPERGLEHFQDARTWALQGLVDAVLPMNYTPDAALFEERLAPWIALRRAGLRVVMGLRVDVGDERSARARLAATREHCDGFAAFAYSSLFDSRNTDLTDQDEETRRARRERREVWLRLLRTPGSGS